MTPAGARLELLGPEVYSLAFAARSAKRFVLVVLGGLTLMVTVWTATILGSSALAVTHESRRVFLVILSVFAVIILSAFNVAWWILGRYPGALVVREKGLVLEHGSQTRVLGFDEVSGIDQREEDGMPTYVVLVTDGSEIAFGAGDGPREAAIALVKQAHLEWSLEPLKARRGPPAAAPSG